jgi:hypothetical protein
MDPTRVDGLQVMQDRSSEGEPSSKGYRSFSGRLVQQTYDFIGETSFQDSDGSHQRS